MKGKDRPPTRAECEKLRREVENLKLENEKLQLSNRALLKEMADRRRSEEELRLSEQKFRVLAEQSPNMIFIQKKGRVVYVNQRCTELLNFGRDEIFSPEFDFFGLFTPDTVELAKSNFEKQLKNMPVPPYEYTMRTKDGRLIEVIISTEMIDFEEQPAILGIVTDISDRKRAEEHLSYMARHDVLSGLPNRELFNYRLALEIMHAKRGERKLAVMLLDLDNFKSVNDTLGHDTGDHLLKLVSRRLSNLLRQSDTIARMGGDEFLLLMPALDRERSAERIARRILEAVREPFVFDEHALNITVSIGIALFPEHGEDVVTLVKNADIAMYRSKERGRDTFITYEAGEKAEGA